MIKLWYFSKANFIFKLTLLFLQLKLYLCLSENHFGDCVPKKCGNLSITYPFYMLGQQKIYCGYPGFEISCKDDKFAYINISGSSYVIKNVSYGEQTVQVVNSLLLDSFGGKIACSGELNHLNLTLNNDVFRYSVNHSQVFLVLNCPEKVLHENSPSWVYCGGVGVYGNETRLNDLKGKCGNGVVVSVPYEGERKNDGNLKVMLEEGFALKWSANNCSACKASKGQCGYDQEISEFSCFCPDKTHARHCLPPVLMKKNNHFGDCAPKICGNLSVSYPFYLVDQQKTYCGYPGFEISCKNEKYAYINISGSSYVIKNVSYGEQTVQVVNSLLLDSFGGSIACSRPLKHLNSTLNNDVFKYTSDSKHILLLLKCTRNILQQHLPESVICGAVGVYEDDPNLKYLEGKCNGTISVPYERENENENVSNITKVLEKGFGLKWNANSCHACKASKGQCGYDQEISEFTCFCPDRAHSRQCPPLILTTKKNLNWRLLLALGASTTAILIVIAVVICAKRKTAGKIAVRWITRAKGNKNVEAFLKIYGSLGPNRYTYSDIKLMTNSFKHKLGEGGYGTVYKGELQDGRLVAVKKLKNLKGNGEEFMNEVVSISRTNHVNVVSLLGFCSQGNNRALVYEFMPNGSLEKFICESKQSLPRETMVDIAVGVAKGLDYLHRGCNARILHLDIKPHNILLDQEFCPKISDFGLAKLSETKNSITSMLEARGTVGYIAPEVFCRNFGGVSHKSDVYSYGMMVLDMACGRKNPFSRAQSSSEQYFPDWIYNQLELEEEVGVPGILNHDHDERWLLRKMILVGLWCIQTYPSNRPSMSKVVEMLEGEVDSIEMPPKPLLCAPPRSASECSVALVTAPLSLQSQL